MKGAGVPLEPYLQDADFVLYQGDALEVLRGLPDESVHCVVTSPPYWGLRDYGTGTWEGGDAECDHARQSEVSRQSSTLVGSTDTQGGTYAWKDECGKCGARRVDQQLGLEPTPDQYVTNMVALFREVRRVLRRDGTCWLNLGDSYASSPSGQNQTSESLRAWGGGEHTRAKTETVYGRTARRPLAAGLKPKDLVGIPWRVAFALQADGWYLRSDIIWAKPNPMPESVTDRPTKAHEYLFLLTRSPRYFYDADAIRENFTDERMGNPGTNGVRTYAPGDRNDVGQPMAWTRGAELGGRNARSVWEIATQPYPEAHFATFPEELARRCIAAGTSERGCCPECGAPWEREVERGELTATSDRGKHDWSSRDIPYADKVDAQWRGMPGRGYPKETVGWREGCGCYERSTLGLRRDTSPCVVLDPFMGSGTVAHVARKLGRHSIGIELNPDYCELAARRLAQQSLLVEGEVA